MNECHLVQEKAGLKQSSLYMLKLSCLKVWDVLQSLFTNSKIRSLNKHDNHKSFKLLHVKIRKGEAGWFLCQIVCVHCPISLLASSE